MRQSSSESHGFVAKSDNTFPEFGGAFCCWIFRNCANYPSDSARFREIFGSPKGRPDTLRAGYLIRFSTILLKRLHSAAASPRSKAVSSLFLNHCFEVYLTPATSGCQAERRSPES